MKAIVVLGRYLALTETYAGQARSMREEGLDVLPIVAGSIPAKTIVEESKAKHIDMIMVALRGRGGLKLLLMGSVANQVVEGADSMIFIMPIPDENETES